MRAESACWSPARRLPRQPGGRRAARPGSDVAIVAARRARAPQRTAGGRRLREVADIRRPSSTPSFERHRPQRRRASGLHRHAGQEERPRIRVLRWTWRARANRARSLRAPHRRRNGSSSARAARPTATTPTIRLAHRGPIRCAATGASPTPSTSAWSRRCWPTTASEHPQLEQVVFRIGTILGATVKNQITDLFEKPRLLAMRGSDSPFVFVWDQDVVGCIVQASAARRPGIFNVAGDGELTIDEIAATLGKRCVVLPARRAARGACAAEALAPDPVRPGADRLPALSPGARQHGA